MPSSLHVMIVTNEVPVIEEEQLILNVELIKLLIKKFTIDNVSN